MTLGSRVIVTAIVMNFILLFMLGAATVNIAAAGEMPVPAYLMHLPTVVMNSISYVLNLGGAVFGHSRAESRRGA